MPEEKRRAKRARGARRGALAVVCLLALLPAAPARAQDPDEDGRGDLLEDRPGALEDPAAASEGDGGDLRIDELLDALSSLEAGSMKFSFNPQTRTGVAFLGGQVDFRYTFRGEPVRVFADRMMLEVRPAMSGGETGAGGAWRQYENFVFLAQGGVRLELPRRETYLEADELYYENIGARAVARGVRLATAIAHVRSAELALSARELVLGAELAPEAAGGDPFARSRISVRADTLRLYGFELYDGEGVRIASDEFAVPQLAVEARTVEVYPLDSTPERRDALRRGELGRLAFTPPSAGEEIDFIIDPEGSWLQYHDFSLAPLPIARWDTRWNDFFPIRSVEFGRSSEFGQFVGADWNVNYFLKQFPLQNFLPFEAVEKEGRYGFETIYMEKRGFGWGPYAIYGDSPRKWQPWQLQLDGWSYHGEAQYFAVHDEGDEDRSTGLPVPQADRYWGHVWHRQAVPRLGYLDFEYSNLSDRAFLGEYFESIEKNEKEQENIIYWRRNLRDNTAVTGLYKFRIDDFVSDVERLPEGKLFLYQEPLGRTGLFTDLELQAARLRVRQDDALGIDDRDYSRFDVVDELAYPFGVAPYFQARPFGAVRYTYYSELEDPAAGDRDRVTLGAGVSVAQQWSRVFPLGRDSLTGRLFHASHLRHVIVPRVSYVNYFENTLDPEETIPVDDVDAVDSEETISLSLINLLSARQRVPSAGRLPTRPGLLGPPDELLDQGRYRTRDLFDNEVSLIVYPQPARDNGGDHTSLLLIDQRVHLLERLSVRGWLTLDPNEDFRGDRLAAAVSYNLFPDLMLTVGDRYYRDGSNVGYVWTTLQLSDKWFLDGYYSRDFEDQRDVEIRFGVGRRFRRFVVTVSYDEDVGEDRNRTVRFGVAPLEIFQSQRQQARGY